MSNKYKRVLIFAILYTVLFVFDGVKLLASLMPSEIANNLDYLVYVVLALYGSFYLRIDCSNNGMRLDIIKGDSFLKS